MGRGGNTSVKTTENLSGLRTKSKNKEIKNNLVPLGEQYMENDFNVLLIGEHGTGKTASILQIAEKLGYKVKMFSCATMDPYTDLIGVPVPKQDENGEDHLKLVRPRDLDEAEVIFFDEINRGSLPTQNAVFEIIQFGTINGEKLPKLKCCWAAMNPDNGDYNVENLDPALLDRFDAYQELKPKPSVEYMTTKMPKPIAQALVSWWTDQNRQNRGPESYISPRRLEKIGILFNTLGSARAVQQALPPGGTYDSKKLITMLTAARDGKSVEDVSKLKTSRSANLDSITKKISSGKKIPKPEIEKKKDLLIKHFKKNPGDIQMQRAILNSFSSGMCPEDLVDKFGDLMLATSPSAFESWRREPVFANSLKKNYKGNRFRSYLSKGETNDWYIPANQRHRFQGRKCALKPAQREELKKRFKL